MTSFWSLSVFVIACLFTLLLCLLRASQFETRHSWVLLFSAPDQPKTDVKRYSKKLTSVKTDPDLLFRRRDKDTRIKICIRFYVPNELTNERTKRNKSKQYAPAYVRKKTFLSSKCNTFSQMPLHYALWTMFVNLRITYPQQNVLNLVSTTEVKKQLGSAFNYTATVTNECT